jgi:Na+(H+)/acetate symporter ActP
MQDHKHDVKGYWSATLGLLTKILIVWFLVSFGAGILFADMLNGIKSRRLPAGILVCPPRLDVHLHRADFLVRQENGRHRSRIRRSRRLRGPNGSANNWIYLVVGASFALYIGIAIWARAGSTSEFYAAGGSVPPVMNGMATAADWMSAASFISMAGLIANMGYGGGLFLMGWTGGYVLLAMLLAPYLRKFGKFTVPQFIGDRFYSKTASTVAVLCLLTASLTYIIGQMTGVGVAFSRFLGVSSETGIYVGMAIVFAYAVFGGMKGITYTQVAQYIVLICAYIVPAIFISLHLTGNPIPQLGLGSNMTGTDVSLLSRLDRSWLNSASANTRPRQPAAR